MPTARRPSRRRGAALPMRPVSSRCSPPPGRLIGRSSSPTAGSSRPRWPRRSASSKFTLAELEEEEQSLERLRRWHRDLTVARRIRQRRRAASASARLKECVAVCEDYAERVFRALHGTEWATSDDGTGDVDRGRGIGHGGCGRCTRPGSPPRSARTRIAANLGGFSDDAVTSLLVLGGLLALYDGAEVLLKPVFGTLADRIGARPVLLGGLVAFAAASAAVRDRGQPRLAVGRPPRPGRRGLGVLARGLRAGRPAQPGRQARPRVRQLRLLQVASATRSARCSAASWCGSAGCGCCSR